jgi:hypothetical protein
MILDVRERERKLIARVVSNHCLRVELSNKQGQILVGKNRGFQTAETEIEAGRVLDIEAEAMPRGVTIPDEGGG